MSLKDGYQMVYEYYQQELEQFIPKTINCVYGTDSFFVENLLHGSGLTLKRRMSFQASKKDLAATLFSAAISVGKQNTKHVTR